MAKQKVKKLWLSLDDYKGADYILWTKKPILEQGIYNGFDKDCFNSEPFLNADIIVKLFPILHLKHGKCICLKLTYLKDGIKLEKV